MAKFLPFIPFQTYATRVPSGENEGCISSPGLEVKGTSRTSAVSFVVAAVYTSVTAKTAATAPSAAAAHRHFDGLDVSEAAGGGVSFVLSGVAVNGAINRYPRRACVSTNLGFSAVSPRASRSFRMALLIALSKSSQKCRLARGGSGSVRE